MHAIHECTGHDGEAATQSGDINFFRAFCIRLLDRISEGNTIWKSGVRVMQQFAAVSW